MTKNTAVVIAACLTSFFSSFMSSSINVAIPAIAASFAVNPETVPIAVSAYVITVTAMIFPAIALANRFGFRNIFAFGALTCALAAFLVPLAPSFTLFVAGRALQGVCNSALFCTNMALLAYHTPRGKRGYYFGLTVASVYAGISLAPTLGGVITDTIGWRFMFYLTFLGNLAAYFLVKRVEPEPPVTHGYPYRRMVLCTISFIMLFVALSSITKFAWSPYLLAAGLICLFVYLSWEKHSAKPLLSISLMIENKVLSFSLLAACCNYMANFATSLLLSMHLQLIAGFTATATGFILMVQPLCQCVLSPVAGRLTGRVSPHVLVLSGMGLSAAAMYLFSTLGTDGELRVLGAAMVIGGCGFALFSSPNTTLVMGSVDKTKLALVSGLLSLARNFGMASSMAVINVIIASILTAAPDTTLYVRELNITIRHAFLFSVLMGLCGMAFCAASAVFYRKNAREP